MTRSGVDPRPRALSIGYAVPVNTYGQRQVFDEFAYPEKFWRIFRDCGIEARHFVGDLPKMRRLSFQEQQETYREKAVDLSIRAIDKCLDGRSIHEVAAISFSSCTGIIPGPVAGHYIHRHYGLGPHIDIGNNGFQGCFPPGVDIVSRDEVKDITQVKTGDEVLGHDGLFHRVLDTFVRPYNGEVVTLETYSLPDIRMTTEQPVRVIRSKTKHREIFKPTSKRWGSDKDIDWSPQWIEAADLRYGDYLLVPKYKTQTELSHLCPKDHLDSQRKPIKDLPEDLLWEGFIRLCGLYVAEGSATHEGGIDFSLNQFKYTNIQELVDTLSALGLSPSVGPNRGSSGTAKSTRVRVASVSLARLLRGWFGSGAMNKKLPPWVFDLSPKLKQLLIDAMWDGDGDRNELKYQIRYATISTQLAQQLYLLLASLDQAASWRIEDNERGWGNNPINRVSLRPGTKRKRLWFSDDDYIWLPIKAVKREHYEGPVHNLKVHGCNSYVAGMISVHNCDGAFPGIRRCLDYSRITGKSTLVISCELSSCTYYPEERGLNGMPDAENGYELLRAHALFADAASCLLIGYGDQLGNSRAPAIIDTLTYVDTKYIGDLGYTWRNGRLRCLLSRRVPAAATDLAEAVARGLLGKHGLKVEDINYWIIHPAGGIVLDMIQRRLRIAEAKMDFSRAALREYGNCSSATVGIIAKLLMNHTSTPEGFMVMINIGPGMTADATLMEFDDG